MKMTYTHDEKIINFDVAKGYKEFMAMFDEYEIEEMRKWLEDNFDFDYSWTTLKEASEGIVIDYVREWLIENIRQFRFAGTKQLFNVLYSL